jgi:glucose/mannose-6-phosphate isomerase
MVLDDLKYLHDRDPQDALGLAAKQAAQYRYNFTFDWSPSRSVQTIVFAGMGGSGLAGKAYLARLPQTVPFLITQDYDLPAYVTDTTLVICASHSGNTAETLSVLDAALARTPQPLIVVITAGGQLLERAEAHQLPCLRLPSGYQPRYTFGFQYRALLEVLDRLDPTRNLIGDLETASDGLSEQLASWLPIVPSQRNPAKQLALECIGNSIVIYGGPRMAAAAYRWKISFNENAKHIAWTNQYPEFNHNEFIGWSKQPVDKPYTVIELRSSLEEPSITRRFTLSERLLSGLRPAPHVISPLGDTLTQQLLWAVAFGDFVSLYVALLNGVNPTPVDLIEKFKQQLNDGN